MPSPDPAGRPTRERILDAAGEVFAQAGYRDATVRDICARAGANLAAVNYHFRDKAALYTEVIDAARLCSTEQYPVDGGLSAKATPEERLAAFVRALMMRLFDLGRPTWHTKLISREMIEPTAALDMIVQRGIVPQFAYLRGIVTEILGSKADERTVVYAAASIVGQCLHHHHCRAVTERMMPGLLKDPGFVGAASEHITRFSLYALRGLAAEQRGAALWRTPRPEKRRAGRAARVGRKRS